MLLGSGYLIPRGGAIFQTRFHIITVDDESVAEPGDLVRIEDNKIKNLSRLGNSCGNVVFPLAGVAWLRHTAPALSLC